jgi:carboxyl-terminal processing protease
MTLQRKLLLVVLIAAVFGVGYWFGGEYKVCPVCPPQNVDFSVMWEAWQKLAENYVDPSKINNQKMVYGAAAGMVKSLGDPYTTFFNPDETKRFLEDVTGEFQGVGMEIGIKDGQLQVVSPIEGTPAAKAGLKPGDKILKIGDKITTDIPTEEAVSLIRGLKGTSVILTIFRDSWGSAKEITIERDIIKVPSLKWEIKNSDVAYIRIYSFSEALSSDFQAAAAKILKTSAKKMIIDLRGNPGGYLEVAQDIAGWFLEKGQTVVIEDFGQGKEENIYKAQGNSRFVGYSVVVLVDSGTASASEILASALRDNRKIKLVGVTSFGKGSVQKLEDLSDGSSLKVTVAHWLTPNREQISEKGLKPDIEIKMTEEDYKQEKDPQLDKALEIIKELK